MPNKDIYLVLPQQFGSVLFSVRASVTGERAEPPDQVVFNGRIFHRRRLSKLKRGIYQHYDIGEAVIGSYAIGLEDKVSAAFLPSAPGFSNDAVTFINRFRMDRRLARIKQNLTEVDFFSLLIFIDKALTLKYRNNPLVKSFRTYTEQTYLRGLAAKFLVPYFLSSDSQNSAEDAYKILNLILQENKYCSKGPKLQSQLKIPILSTLFLKIYTVFAKKNLLDKGTFTENVAEFCISEGIITPELIKNFQGNSLTEFKIFFQTNFMTGIIIDLRNGQIDFLTAEQTKIWVDSPIGSLEKTIRFDWIK